MRVLIAVATANAALRTFVLSKRDLIVPPESLSKGYLREANVRFSSRIFAIDKDPTSLALGEWLARLAQTADGLILIIDQQYRHLASDYEDAYFIVSLPEPHGKILQNYIRSALAPILRNYSLYSQRFDTLNHQRLLLLPLDIFLAEDLKLLRACMTHEKMDSGFGQRLEYLLAALRSRARPKTRTRFKRSYVVDDRPLWYRYGPEEHAYVETTAPPHDLKCWHNSAYRFGRAYNPRLHHNVDDDSVPTQVYGEFIRCHGQGFTATGESHLNIFPNGHF